MDPMNERALRQTISALSGEEVSIALEIMLALHPNRYLNTLAQGYITMKSDNDQIKEVVDSRSNYIRIITGEIDNPANFERFMNPPIEKIPEENFEEMFDKVAVPHGGADLNKMKEYIKKAKAEVSEVKIPIEQAEEMGLEIEEPFYEDDLENGVNIVDPKEIEIPDFLK